MPRNKAVGLTETNKQNTQKSNTSCQETRELISGDHLTKDNIEKVSFIKHRS